MLEKNLFRDFSGNQFNRQEFLTEIKAYDGAGYEFYIGTDSQVFVEHISYVTCICSRKNHGGYYSSGKVFYYKQKLPKRDFPSLRTRMLHEALQSLELAMDLDSIINNKISIHLDVGSNLKSKSAVYQKELECLITAQGFDCSCKPNSWSASSVADRVSKS